MAFDYHQVIDTDRYGSRGDADRVTSAGALPPRHVGTIRRLRNLIESLGAFVKIVIVSHIHDSVVNKQNLVTAVQSVFTSHLHVIHLGLWAFGCCGATPTVPFLDSYLLRLTSVEVSFDFIYSPLSLCFICLRRLPRAEFRHYQLVCTAV